MSNTRSRLWKEWLRWYKQEHLVREVADRKRHIIIFGIKEHWRTQRDEKNESGEVHSAKAKWWWRNIIYIWQRSPEWSNMRWRELDQGWWLKNPMQTMKQCLTRTNILKRDNYKNKCIRRNQNGIHYEESKWRDK